VTAGASAGSLFLGLFRKPPILLLNSSNRPLPPTLTQNKHRKPKVKLGYIPIVEALPTIAKEMGFAKYGMTDVELAKQASWVQCG